MGGGLVVSLIVSFISLVKTSELNTPGLQGKSSWYHENPWEISDFISCTNTHLMVRKIEDNKKEYTKIAKIEPAPTNADKGTQEEVGSR